MVAGIVGVKVGTSRLFNEDGNSMLVTVVEAKPNLVCQIKTKDKDGYSALQLAYGTQKPQRLSKALRGHYAKNKVPVSRSLNEIRISPQQEEEFNVGDQISVSQFVAGQRVDATGVSKGKGFSGSVKRWNFAMQDATHGNSISHRHLGSTGQCQWPGKVWKGKKMAGQYGNKRSTSTRLQVAMVDEENNAIFITGAIPGAPGTEVIIKPAVKQTPAELAFVSKKLEELANQEDAVAEQVDENDAPEQAMVADEKEDYKVDEAKPEAADDKGEDKAEDEDKKEESKPAEEAKPEAEDKVEETKPAEEDKKDEAKAEGEAAEDKKEDAKAEAKPTEEAKPAEEENKDKKDDKAAKPADEKSGDKDES